MGSNGASSTSQPPRSTSIMPPKRKAEDYSYGSDCVSSLNGASDDEITVLRGCRNLGTYALRPIQCQPTGSPYQSKRICSMDGNDSDRYGFINGSDLALMSARSTPSTSDVDSAESHSDTIEMMGPKPSEDEFGTWKIQKQLCGK